MIFGARSWVGEVLRLEHHSRFGLLRCRSNVWGVSKLLVEVSSARSAESRKEGQEGQEG